MKDHIRREDMESYTNFAFFKAPVISDPLPNHLFHKTVKNQCVTIACERQKRLKKKISTSNLLSL